MERWPGGIGEAKPLHVKIVICIDRLPFIQGSKSLTPHTCEAGRSHYTDCMVLGSVNVQHFCTSGHCLS